MNSYSLKGVCFKKPYGIDLIEQNKILDDMYSTIEGMKCYNKKGDLLNCLQIFQKGILMSITSIKELRNKMDEKFKYKYILTHRTNQDCLENFYSQVRGRNGASDHPTPVECLNNIKTIILGKNPGLASHMHSNTIEQDPEEYVSAKFNKVLSENKSAKSSGSKEFHRQKNELEEFVDEEYLSEEFLRDNFTDVPENTREENCDHMPEEFQEVEYLSDEFINDDFADVPEKFIEEKSDSMPEEYEEYLTIEFLESNVGEEYIEKDKEFLENLSNEMRFDVYGARTAKSTEDGLEYIAGWIAWRVKEEHPNFSKSRRESLPSHITDHTYAKRVGLSSNSWIDYISHGGLTKPSEQMLQWVKDMEEQFLKIHGNEFNYRMNIMKELIKTLEGECSEIPVNVIKLFAKSRIYMRCKYLNKKRVDEALMANKLKRKGRAEKRRAEALEDLSRTKAKKMKKITT